MQDPSLRPIWLACPAGACDADAVTYLRTGYTTQRVNQVVPVSSRKTPMTWALRYGLGKNTLPAGKSSSSMWTRPDVATILIGGQRSRTNRASFNPSIEPGI